MAKQITVVTGTIGQDSHVIGIKILAHVLRDHGFKTVELGALTLPEEFIKAAKETGAAVILISSLYGMGEMDLKGFKEKCKEAGLNDVLLYLGGYLAVGRHDWKEDEERFKAMGFDRVYPPEVDLKVAIADLKEDLKKKGKL